MKFRTTQKAVRANFAAVIRVPCYGLQHLLADISPVAYTVRPEGWGADVYDMGGGVAVATGYAPFGNIEPPFGMVYSFDEKAENIRHDNSLSWEEQCKQINRLQREFVKEVLHHA